MTWWNGSLLLLNSWTRSGSSRGSDFSLTRYWMKDTLVACRALMPWISAEYSVSSTCSTMQATSLRGNRDSRGHRRFATKWNRAWVHVYTGQAMYLLRNIEILSCNHCCRLKAISIAYSEYVFVALVIQHARCMHHIIICILPGSTIFFHISS
jgi:hypothetical protein